MDNGGYSWQAEPAARRFGSRLRESPSRKPRPFPRSGFFLLSAAALTLTSLRYASAMLMNIGVVFKMKKCGFKCVPTLRNGSGCKQHLDAFAMAPYLEKKT